MKIIERIKSAVIARKMIFILRTRRASPLIFIGFVAALFFVDLFAAIIPLVFLASCFFLLLTVRRKGFLNGFFQFIQRDRFRHISIRASGHGLINHHIG